MNQKNRTRMTQMLRIFTDLCKSAQSVSSVFQFIDRLQSNKISNKLNTSKNIY